VIDATAMTNLHFDVWMPQATSFTVKLVDFGADGAYGGTAANADTEATVSKTSLTTKAWQSLVFALSDFTALGARAHLAQMIITSDAGATVYVDNVYFWK
jgi:hypothetical protein